VHGPLLFGVDALSADRRFASIRWRRPISCASPASP
jgi:hypothetical protein